MTETRNLLASNQYGFRRKKSTVDAIRRLMVVVNNRVEGRYIVEILTLDIKKTFNSTPLRNIMTAFRVKGVPSYLCLLLGSYFNNRTLMYEAGKVSTSRSVIVGIPQVSVLGPTIWNFFYDELRVELPEGVELIAYADDIAIVAHTAVTFKVGELLKAAAEKMITRLENVGIDLTP